MDGRRTDRQVKQLDDLNSGGEGGEVQNLNNGAKLKLITKQYCEGLKLTRSNRHESAL